MVEPPRRSERYTNYLSIIYMYTQRAILTLINAHGGAQNRELNFLKK